MSKSKMPSCFGARLNSSITCFGCDWEYECNKEFDIEISKPLINVKLHDERISKDLYYLDIALAVSKRSTCLRRHYGAVIVKDDRIVATGYNGSPRGEVNCCDKGECQRKNEQRYAGYDKCPAVHAEQNAMIFASHDDMKDAILYLACEERDDEAPDDLHIWNEDTSPCPCPMCAKMILNSGISRVVNRAGEIDGLN